MWWPFDCDDGKSFPSIFCELWGKLMIFGNAFRALARKGYPIVTPIIRDVYRIKGIVRFGLIPLARSLSWYFRSNEYTNFTYDISEKSEKYLSAFLANALDASREETISYLNEVRTHRKTPEIVGQNLISGILRYFSGQKNLLESMS